MFINAESMYVDNPYETVFTDIDSAIDYIVSKTLKCNVDERLKDFDPDEAFTVRPGIVFSRGAVRMINYTACSIDELTLDCRHIEQQCGVECLDLEYIYSNDYLLMQ